MNKLNLNVINNNLLDHKVRHVVLGAESFVGTLLLKLLITIGEDISIVAISRSGFIATEIPGDQIEVQVGDILDPLSLYEILEEGDIIYNTQIFFDLETDLSEIEFTNHTGLVNLLGVAGLNKVKKVITYLPQQEGWKIPSVATETSIQKEPDEFQKITRKTLGMIDNYWRRNEFGWPSKDIRAWVKQNIDEPKYPIKFYDDEDYGVEEEQVETDGEETDEEGGQIENEGTIEEEKPVEMPQEENDVVIDEDKELTDYDELQLLDDEEIVEDMVDEEQEELKQLDEEVEREETVMEKFWRRQRDEIKKRDERKKELDVELDKQKEKEDTEWEKKRERRRREIRRVPLVVGRFGRLFGGYDRRLTLEYCDAIRKGSMTVIGKIDQKISWITPVDMARALIILGDKTVPKGQFILNSFLASSMEILNELDKINLTKIEMTHLDLSKELRKLRICNFLSKFKLCKHRSERELLKFNTRQVFTDEKAVKRWNWFPRMSFEKACLDAFQWYLEVIVPEKYPLG